MNDKNIEKKRFDKYVDDILNKKKFLIKKSLYLKPAYLYYYSLFKLHGIKSKLLEIASGRGENTTRLLRMKFNVTATDISPKSVKFMKKYFSYYKKFSSHVADMEKLPFKNESFGIICCADSLSYGDNNKVMNEIYRVLKVGGVAIFIDSLNDNPIYRLNRYINYLLGIRSKSTLRRMPNVNLINEYIKKFGYGKVKFFGSIIWSALLLKIMLSEKLITKFYNWVDNIFKINTSAFKFVLILVKKK